jgi:DNA-binding MarR family transcriptional regulator
VLEQFLGRVVAVAESTALDPLMDLGLTFSQVRTLFILAARADAAPITDIAQARHMSLAATGRSIDGLVQAGLVERREDPNDRRVRLVSLSASGRDLVNKHVDTKHQVLQALTRDLPDHARDALYEAIVLVLDSEVLPATGVCGVRDLEAATETADVGGRHVTAGSAV